MARETARDRKRIRTDFGDRSFSEKSEIHKKDHVEGGTSRARDARELASLLRNITHRTGEASRFAKCDHFAKPRLRNRFRKRGSTRSGFQPQNSPKAFRFQPRKVSGFILTSAFFQSKSFAQSSMESLAESSNRRGLILRSW